MKITFYGYNSFIVSTDKHKIAIDPGALFLYWFRLTTLIPKSEWKGITHIVVTHGEAFKLSAESAGTECLILKKNETISI